MSHTRAIRLFCSDLDGTLLGEPDGVREFTACWKRLPEPRPLLVYSSGRLLDDARRQVEAAGLPAADFFVSGVGTTIDGVAEGNLAGFGEVLNHGWNAELADQIAAAMPDIERQPDEQLHQWKRSWFWYDREEADLEKLRQSLREAGLEAQVVYSSGRDLDILPAGANKGNALRWLCAHRGVSTGEVVVAGDTGNDVSMFLLPEVRGVMPGNAAPELVRMVSNREIYHARGCCAHGIVEGLRHFGLFGG